MEAGTAATHRHATVCVRGVGTGDVEDGDVEDGEKNSSIR